MNVVMFPGQGAQSVGMGKALADTYPSAKAAFEEANDALGYDLAALCFEGPAERLVPTDVCQPAILAASVAAWRAARENGLDADAVIGHSLGEYSALVASGAIAYADALKLVAERGAAMHAAGQERPGTMAALLGQSDDDATALCKEIGDIWPANFNCPGQIVLSGTVEAVEKLVAIAGERGLKAKPLEVGGAFHSPLMEPAADRLEPALAATEVNEPQIRFFSTTSLSDETAATIRENLLAQLRAPVRFGHAAEALLAEGVDQFVEVGPGRVLSGLIRRVDRGATTHQIADPDQIAAYQEKS